MEIVSGQEWFKELLADHLGLLTRSDQRAAKLPHQDVGVAGSPRWMNPASSGRTLRCL